MKTVRAKFLDFLKAAPQFMIPPYQRPYVWSEKECRQLWEDIVRCGSDDSIPMHFIGSTLTSIYVVESIIYEESGLSQATRQPFWVIIEGQQRVTTASLLLAALAEAVGDTEPYEGFSKPSIRNNYLLNPGETGERHFKLLLSRNDKETLIALVGGGPLPENPSPLLVTHYHAFQQWIKSEKIALSTICKGLTKLEIADMFMSR
jgi:uncharacterized protein with ParB-like and HNH nuclease domain